MTVSVAVLVIELVAGIAGNSLALMADAGHVFADVSGMALSLGAIWLADRPADGSRSFGLYRLEILAAALNAVLLFGVSLFILWEGVRRLVSPPAVESSLVIGIAVLALAANLVSLSLLARGRNDSLTLRGARLEVLGDLLGAAAVLVAGVVIALTGFTAADAIASILIAVLILPRTWSLLRESLNVLLEASPEGHGPLGGAPPHPGGARRARRARPARLDHHQRHERGLGARRGLGRRQPWRDPGPPRDVPLGRLRHRPLHVPAGDGRARPVGGPRGSGPALSTLGHG